MNRPRGPRVGRFSGPRGRGRGNNGFGGGGGNPRPNNREFSPEGDAPGDHQSNFDASGVDNFQGDNYAAGDRPTFVGAGIPNAPPNFPRMGMHNNNNNQNGPQGPNSFNSNNNIPPNNFGGNVASNSSFTGNMNLGPRGQFDGPNVRPNMFGGGNNANNNPNWGGNVPPDFGRREGDFPRNAEAANSDFDRGSGGSDFNRSFGSGDFNSSFGSADFSRDSLQGPREGSSSSSSAPGNFNRFSGDGSSTSFERPNEFDGGAANTNNPFVNNGGFNNTNNNNNRPIEGMNSGNDRTSPVFGMPAGGMNVAGMPTGIDFSMPPPSFLGGGGGGGGQFAQDFSVPPPSFNVAAGAPPLAAPINNDFPGGFNNGGNGNPGFRFPMGGPPRGGGNGGTPMANRNMHPHERGGYRGRFDSRGGSRGPRFPRGRGRGMTFQSNMGPGDGDGDEEKEFLPPLSYKWNDAEDDDDGGDDDKGDLGEGEHDVDMRVGVEDPNIGADAIPPPSPGTPTEEMENETRHYCPGCMSNFDDKEQFQQHLETCQETEDSATPSEFLCSVCSSIFVNQDEYHDHLRNEHDMSICRLCSAEFPKKEDLKHHVDVTHRKLKEDVKTAKKMGFTTQTSVSKRGRPLSFYKKLGKKGSTSTASSATKSATSSFSRSTSLNAKPTDASAKKEKLVSSGGAVAEIAPTKSITTTITTSESQASFSSSTQLKISKPAAKVSEISTVGKKAPDPTVLASASVATEPPMELPSEPQPLVSEEEKIKQSAQKEKSKIPDEKLSDIASTSVTTTLTGVTSAISFTNDKPTSVPSSTEALPPSTSSSMPMSIADLHMKSLFQPLESADSLKHGRISSDLGETSKVKSSLDAIAPLIAETKLQLFQSQRQYHIPSSRQMLPEISSKLVSSHQDGPKNIPLDPVAKSPASHPSTPPRHPSTPPRDESNVTSLLAGKTLTPGSRVKQYEKSGFKVRSKMAITSSMLASPTLPRVPHQEEPTWTVPPRKGVPWGPGIDDGLPDKAPFLPHSLWAGNSSPSQVDSGGEFSEQDFEQLDANRMFAEPEIENSPSPPPPPPSPPPPPPVKAAHHPPRSSQRPSSHHNNNNKRSPLSTSPASGGRSSGRSLEDIHDKDNQRGIKKIEPEIAKKRRSMTQRWVARSETSSSPPPPLAVGSDKTAKDKTEERVTPPPPPSPPSSSTSSTKVVKFDAEVLSPPVKSKYKDESTSSISKGRRSLDRKGGWPREDVTMQGRDETVGKSVEEEAAAATAPEEGDGIAWLEDDFLAKIIGATRTSTKTSAVEEAKSTIGTLKKSSRTASGEKSNDDDDDEEEEEEEDSDESDDDDEDSDSEIEKMEKRIAKLKEKLMVKEAKDKEKAEQKEAKQKEKEDRKKEKELKKAKMEAEKKLMEEEEEKRKKREEEKQQKAKREAARLEKEAQEKKLAAAARLEKEAQEKKLAAAAAAEAAKMKKTAARKSLSSGSSVKSELLPSRSSSSSSASKSSAKSFDLIGSIIGDTNVAVAAPSTSRSEKKRLEKDKRVCPETANEMLQMLNQSTRPDKVLPPKHSHKRSSTSSSVEKSESKSREETKKEIKDDSKKDAREESKKKESSLSKDQKHERKDAEKLKPVESKIKGETKERKESGKKTEKDKHGGRKEGSEKRKTDETEVDDEPPPPPPPPPPPKKAEKKASVAATKAAKDVSTMPAAATKDVSAVPAAASKDVGAVPAAATKEVSSTAAVSKLPDIATVVPVAAANVAPVAVSVAPVKEKEQETSIPSIGVATAPNEPVLTPPIIDASSIAVDLSDIPIPPLPPPPQPPQTILPSVVAKPVAVPIDDTPAIEPSMFDINLDSIPLPEDPAPRKMDINDSAHPVDMEMSDDEETEHGESVIGAAAEEGKEESPEPLAPPGVSPEASPRAFFGKEPSPAFASQPTRDPFNAEISQASKPASPSEKPQLPSPTTATSASASSSLVSSPVFSDVADPEKTQDILVSSAGFQLVNSQEALHLTTPPPPPPPPPPSVSVKEQSNPVEENQTTAVKFSLSSSKDSKDARRSIEIAQRVKEKEEREKERQKAEAAKKKSSTSSATAPSKTGVEMLFKEYGTAVFEKQKLEEKKREEEKKAEQKRKEEERRKAEKKAEERKKEEKKLREEKRKKREEEDKKREEEKKKREEERLKKEKDERTKKEDDKKRDERRKAKEKEKDKHHHSRKREGSSKEKVDGVKERISGEKESKVKDKGETAKDKSAAVAKGNVQVGKDDADVVKNKEEMSQQKVKETNEKAEKDKVEVVKDKAEVAKDKAEVAKEGAKEVNASSDKDNAEVVKNRDNSETVKDNAQAANQSADKDEVEMVQDLMGQTSVSADVEVEFANKGVGEDKADVVEASAEKSEIKGNQVAKKGENDEAKTNPEGEGPNSEGTEKVITPEKVTTPKSPSKSSERSSRSNEKSSERASRNHSKSDSESKDQISIHKGKRRESVREKRELKASFTSDSESEGKDSPMDQSPKRAGVTIAAKITTVDSEINAKPQVSPAKAVDELSQAKSPERLTNERRSRDKSIQSPRHSPIKSPRRSEKSADKSPRVGSPSKKSPASKRHESPMSPKLADVPVSPRATRSSDNILEEKAQRNSKLRKDGAVREALPTSPMKAILNKLVVSSPKKLSDIEDNIVSDMEEELPASTSSDKSAAEAGSGTALRTMQILIKRLSTNEIDQWIPKERPSKSSLFGANKKFTSKNNINNVTLAVHEKSAETCTTEASRGENPSSNLPIETMYMSVERDVVSDSPDVEGSLDSEKGSEDGEISNALSRYFQAVDESLPSASEFVEPAADLAPEHPSSNDSSSEDGNEGEFSDSQESLDTIPAMLSDISEGPETSDPTGFITCVNISANVSPVKDIPTRKRKATQETESITAAELNERVTSPSPSYVPVNSSEANLKTPAGDPIQYILVSNPSAAPPDGASPRKKKKSNRVQPIITSRQGKQKLERIKMAIVKVKTECVKLNVGQNEFNIKGFNKIQRRSARGEGEVLSWSRDMGATNPVSKKDASKPRKPNVSRHFPPDLVIVQVPALISEHSRLGLETIPDSRCDATERLLAKETSVEQVPELLTLNLVPKVAEVTARDNNCDKNISSSQSKEIENSTTDDAVSENDASLLCEKPVPEDSFERHSKGEHMGLCVAPWSNTHEQVVINHSQAEAVNNDSERDNHALGIPPEKDPVIDEITNDPLKEPTKTDTINSIPQLATEPSSSVPHLVDATLDMRDPCLVSDVNHKQSRDESSNAVTDAAPSVNLEFTSQPETAASIESGCENPIDPVQSPVRGVTEPEKLLSPKLSYQSDWITVRKDSPRIVSKSQVVDPKTQALETVVTDCQETMSDSNKVTPPRVDCLTALDPHSGRAKPSVSDCEVASSEVVVSANRHPPVSLDQSVSGETQTKELSVRLVRLDCSPIDDKTSCGGDKTRTHQPNLEGQVKSSQEPTLSDAVDDANAVDELVSVTNETGSMSEKSIASDDTLVSNTTEPSCEKGENSAGLSTMTHSTHSIEASMNTVEVADEAVSPETDAQVVTFSTEKDSHRMSEATPIAGVSVQVQGINPLQANTDSNDRRITRNRVSMSSVEVAKPAASYETESACESEAESGSDQNVKPRRTSRLSLPTSKKRESLLTSSLARGKMTATSPDASVRPTRATSATAVAPPSSVVTRAPAMPTSSRESLVPDYSSSAEPASSATEESENETISSPRRSRRGDVRKTGNAVESPIRSAFEKIKTVMQRVPDHDLEEDFARTPASGSSSSGVERAEAAGTVTAEQSNDGANPQASELPSTAAAAASSSSKANYPARARYHRKRFSIEDATFKPWRSPSPKKKLVDEDWKDDVSDNDPESADESATTSLPETL